MKCRLLYLVFVQSLFANTSAVPVLPHSIEQQPAELNQGSSSAGNSRYHPMFDSTAIEDDAFQDSGIEMIIPHSLRGKAIQQQEVVQEQLQPESYVSQPLQHSAASLRSAYTLHDPPSQQCLYSTPSRTKLFLSLNLHKLEREINEGHHPTFNQALQPSSRLWETPSNSQIIQLERPSGNEPVNPPDQSTKRVDSRAIVKQQHGPNARRQRYSGLEWQTHFSKKEQRTIHEIIERRWGHTFSTNARANAIWRLIEILDVDSARKILDGDSTTIDKVANESSPLQRKGGIKRNLRKNVWQRWPDDNLSKEDRKLIVHRLHLLWNLSASNVRQRLKSHYDPSFAPDLLSKDLTRMKAVADQIHAAVWDAIVRTGNETRMRKHCPQWAAM